MANVLNYVLNYLNISENMLNNVDDEEISSDAGEEDMSKALIEYSEQLENNLARIKKFDYSQFKNKEIIGYGASAVVYSAVIQGKKYALKSLKNNLSFDKRALKRIKREVNTTPHTLENLSKETSIKFIINILSEDFYSMPKDSKDLQLSKETSNELIINNLDILPEDFHSMSKDSKDLQLSKETSNELIINNLDILPEDFHSMSKDSKDLQLSKETSNELIIKNPKIPSEDLHSMSKDSEDLKLSEETSNEFIINNPEMQPKDLHSILKDSEGLKLSSTHIDGRLLMVSQFLPTLATRKSSSASSGLLCILDELAKMIKFIWIGCPGSSEGDKITAQLNECSYHPVFIEDSLFKGHDNFSNSTLWPLFHYHYPGELFFCKEDWNAYKIVNSLFADAISEIVQDGDLIWIHSRQFMLLPDLLRKKLSDRNLNVKIGYFLHVPFPSCEIYRILPVREEILTSILKSDLVGFQTFNHARHFLSSCTSILGLLAKPNRVYYEGRLVHVGIFPIGINPDRFIKSLKESKVQEQIKTLKEKYKGIKIIIGVDRLDSAKGVPQKFHALDLFLSKHPEWIGKVILIQIVTPTRKDSEEYQSFCQAVNELAGKIEGKYSTFVLSPIHFINHSVPFEELLALYKVSDVCIVSSIRDGMNLVPYEYISCQQDSHGVLIISEFAGAAQCLDAVTMNENLRKLNYQKLHYYVTKNTVSFWGKSFVKELARVEEYNSRIVTSHLEINQVLKVAKTAKKRIILLDCDRTLITTHKYEKQSCSPNNIISTLKSLQAKPNTYVYILSGRGRVDLDKWFEPAGVGLSAEHGCFYKHPKCLQEKENPILNCVLKNMTIKEENNNWYRLVEQVDPELKEKLLHLFKHYEVRTHGASVEEKEIGIVWHNNCSDRKFGSRQTMDLQVNLMSSLVHMPLNIILGDNILEIRSSLVDKSAVVRAIFKDLHVTPDHFVLCIGDEKPDEPIFTLLEKNDEFKSLNYFTSNVGNKPTKAKFFLNDDLDVRNLLEKLVSELLD
ncbi:9147_t:CDS:10 [Scutellospora calospora]|uniref:9147_t:CDS:1 n=1 Tax=Scutellospora calospora TaxID=85575 RepID=A0ACA9JUI7_9GLOM|nr:9147_t:CDS:10 [Scutellospora calospora]